MHTMLRYPLKKFLTRVSPNLVSVAKYQNFVTSEALENLEGLCNRHCPVPRFPPQKVAVIGAGSDVGRIVSLFLKQQKIVKILALWDELPQRGVLGVATDIAHIDTSTEVEAYQGRVYLKAALDDSDVVVICGGWYVLPPCCNTPDRDLFFENMRFVRTATIACAEFCPQAIIAVQTPPVDCNFALCKCTLEQNKVYDKRRVLGVNSINAMRANQLFSSLTGTDPAASSTPVIGGSGRCTRVPVFSAGKAGNFPQKHVECLTRLVREADDIICRVKSNYEQGHLSVGFSTARCVLNIMKGLFEKPSFIDSVLVEQADPKKCYDMEICATPVTMGKGGISEYAIPTLNEFETKLLEESKCDLEDMIHLGRCYALGEEYYLHDCRFYGITPSKPCRTCMPAAKKKDNYVCKHVRASLPSTSARVSRTVKVTTRVGGFNSSPSHPCLTLQRGAPRLPFCECLLSCKVANFFTKIHLWNEFTMTSEGTKLYPKCDSSVWLRSCEQEVTEPLEGEITGEIPSWLNGSLLRNGPGSVKMGKMRFKHLFDCSALLHRFAITEGSVTYQCRFLQSNTLRRNRAADRIVVAEFGTAAVPDPCHSIFDRVAAVFKPGDSLSDNAMISLYPFGDEMYAFTEGPVVHRIDPVTLDTMERKNLQTGSVALVNHTSHPHVMNNGDVYNVGMSVVKGRLKHVVVKFPYTEKGDMFASAHVVASMKPRWSLHPAYMHTFGITEHYFVIVEQPLSVSLCGMVRNQLTGQPLAGSLHWYPKHETHIVLLSRSTGKEVKRYRTETIFYLHIINSFERDNKMIIDLCSYKDAKAIDAMYIHAIETMQSNADYAEWFRGRPKRLEVSLSAPNMTRVEPALLADIGCETPRINYELLNGRSYRYFYAISSDVDADNPGCIIKVDTVTGEVKTWSEPGCYPSEPIFVPAPDAKAEDDGVLISSLVFGANPRRVALAVLSARDLHELARAAFTTPSPAPKCLHGWYTASTDTQTMRQTQTSRP